MSIKILGGLAKGFSLSTVSEKELRPTSIILRRKLFDAHQDLRGFLFVDLFAGTGAMGVEAWSRGAEESILVEKHKKIASLIQQNLNSLSAKHPDHCISLRQLDALKWMKGHLRKTLQGFKEGLQTKQLEGVIFFLDPPYQQTSLYQEVLQCLGSALREDGPAAVNARVWLEGDQQKGRTLEGWREALKVPLAGLKWIEVKTYKQSSHFVMILKPEIS